MSLPAKVLSISAVVLLSVASFWQLYSWPTLQTITVGGREFKVEVAATAAARERGLSGRLSLPAEQGMLFVFETDSRPAFWMKGMRFPLDIVWLDRDFKIVGLEKNIAPATYPSTFSPPRPIRYVLEVNANAMSQSS